MKTALVRMLSILSASLCAQRLGVLCIRHRTDGDVGYQFGDVARTSLRCISSTLRKWSSRHKQEEGYEFGDLFLKDLVRTIVVKPEEDSDARSSPEVPTSDDDDDESPEHRQIAASMREKRQKAL